MNVCLTVLWGFCSGIHSASSSVSILHGVPVLSPETMDEVTLRGKKRLLLGMLWTQRKGIGVAKHVGRERERRGGGRGRGLSRPWFPLLSVQQEEQNNNVKQTVRGKNMASLSGRPHGNCRIMWQPVFQQKHHKHSHDIRLVIDSSVRQQKSHVFRVRLSYFRL